MFNKYDDKLTIYYEYNGEKDKVMLSKFRALFYTELMDALNSFKRVQSTDLFDWQKVNLEVEFYQNFLYNFNRYSNSNIKILAVY